MRSFALFLSVVSLVGLSVGLTAGCTSSSAIRIDPESRAQLPKASPDADIVLQLVSNQSRTTFYIDGDSIITGRRVKVLINNRPHTVVAAPEGYRPKEEFIQPPYYENSPLSFTFFIGDKMIAEGDEKEDEKGKTEVKINVQFNFSQAKIQNTEAVALVIGIRDYDHDGVPDVSYAQNDAKVIRTFLVESLGYDEANILPRNPDEPITLGRFKTLVKNQLPSYVKSGRSDVFVFFSGHGAPNVAARKGYLVPADADPNFVNDDNAYSLDEFYQDLAQLNARSLFVALDACFSGFDGRGEMLIREASPLMAEVEYPVLPDDDAAVFTASAANQVANWYSEEQHGMFTYFFLKGVQGEADLNEDGALTVGELEAYLTDPVEGVPYWSRRVTQRVQMPQVQARNKDRILVRYE